MKRVKAPISTRLNTKIQIFGEDHKMHDCFAEVRPMIGSYSSKHTVECNNGYYIISIRNDLKIQVNTKCKVIIYDHTALTIHSVVIPNRSSRILEIIASNHSSITKFQFVSSKVE